MKGLECLGKKCPHCGSENIREVRTYDRRVKKAWWLGIVLIVFGSLQDRKYYHHYMNRRNEKL